MACVFCVRTTKVQIQSKVDNGQLTMPTVRPAITETAWFSAMLPPLGLGGFFGQVDCLGKKIQKNNFFLVLYKNYPDL